MDEYAKHHVRRFVCNSYGPLFKYGQSWHEKRVKKRLERSEGPFTTDDIGQTKRVFDKMDKKLQAEKDEDKREQIAIQERWAKVRRRQYQNLESGVHGERPGVFHVSRPLNTMPSFMENSSKYTEFVVVARDEEEARRTHPESGFDAFTYDTVDSLAREEEWLAYGGQGVRPGWFLGVGNEWIHGGYAEVKRISDYEPPAGQEPWFGVVCSSHVGD
jgi:hypothetical protein